MNKVFMDMFKPKSIAALLHVELDSERRLLLQAQEAYEYAKAMTDYHSVRIAQIKIHIADIQRNES